MGYARRSIFAYPPEFWRICEYTVQRGSEHSHTYLASLNKTDIVNPYVARVLIVPDMIELMLQPISLGVRAFTI